MESNRMGWLVAKVLAGVLLSLVLLVGAPILINNVIANDRLSRERDIEIRTSYREADRLMTERNTEAFNSHMQATSKLEVTVGKLDTSIQFMGQQLEIIANGR